jgi:hypothetical protein
MLINKEFGARKKFHKNVFLQISPGFIIEADLRMSKKPDA